MNKKSIFLISTIALAVILGIFVSFYARGFRFDLDSGKFSSNGILVLKSSPGSAQIFVNGELETATNATLDLLPGVYDVSIRKEGFHSWDKRLSVQKEVVTEATAQLFRSAPSLSAITFRSAQSPVPSPDFTKLAYATLPPTDNNGQDKSGLWVIETVNLPVGFSRDPRQITDGDLTNAAWEFSPDGREILLSTTSSSFLLDASEFTPQNSRVNISSSVDEIKEEWQEEIDQKLSSQIKSLPEPLADFMLNTTSAVVFSPDEDMVLFTAKGNIKLEDNLIKQIPGSSTQKQERNIKSGRTYIYDIKEDRNFEIDRREVVIGHLPLGGANRRLVWFPTSRHLVLAEPEKIAIMDYDATNKIEVYKGAYEAPHAYPTAGTDRLIILTNLGASSQPANLYSLSLK